MFVVCGEALMDVFGAGDTATGVTLDARVGGSPFNVAVGLARLAQPVTFFAAVSRGFLGERLMRALRDEGVAVSAVERVDAPTTLGLVDLDASGVASYAFYGAGGAERQLHAASLALLPAEGIRAVHVGSYASVVEPIAGTLRALVERERATALIACDPNVRLNVEPDLARWRSVLDWMLGCAHLLKISDEDLQLLRPRVDAADFAADALAHGVELVVVTRGGEGASGWTGAAAAHAAPVPVELGDTVGAGDTFQAALLTWLAENDRLAPQALAGLGADELGRALGFAARAAAITCSRRGADMPRRGEV
jgi:fructokinase